MSSPDFRQGIIALKEFGLGALPTGRGEVKPVDYPTVDARCSYNLKSSDRMKQENRGGFGTSEAAKSLV